MDHSPITLQWWQTALILIPTVLVTLLYVKYSQKWYKKIQPYIECKFGVQMIFKRRYIQILGDLSGFKKFLIEIYYLFLVFVAVFGPWIILGLLAWLVGDWISSGE